MNYGDDPFENMRSLNPASMNNSSRGGNRDVLEATQMQDPSQIKDQGSKVPQAPTPVSFPGHLYVPPGAQSVDLRKLATVSNGTTKAEFFRFKSPEGVVTRFLSYGVYNDGALASNFAFIPEVEGNRVFPYHGDPSDNFRISLGLAPDLSNNSLIGCQLLLMPNQEIIWYVTNADTVAADMGVRMVGYFDSTQQISAPRFGG